MKVTVEAAMAEAMAEAVKAAVMVVEKAERRRWGWRWRRGCNGVGDGGRECEGGGEGSVLSCGELGGGD